MSGKSCHSLVYLCCNSIDYIAEFENISKLVDRARYRLLQIRKFVITDLEQAGIM